MMPSSWGLDHDPTSMRNDFSSATSITADSAFAQEKPAPFVEVSFLSHLAAAAKRRVPRNIHQRGNSQQTGFTGRELVSTLEALLQSSERPLNSLFNPFTHASVTARDLSMQIARSLQAQLWVHSVEWHESELCDDDDEIFGFLQDEPGPSGYNPFPMHDLDTTPSSVITPLTSCYSPLCAQDAGDNLFACYSPYCPRARSTPLREEYVAASSSGLGAGPTAASVLTEGSSAALKERKLAWAESVSPEILQSLSKREISRQNEIHEAIQKEEEFYEDLSLLDTLFVPGLERPSPQGDPP